MTAAVLFCILQTGARANGGVQSIDEVIRRLDGFRPVVLTNIESAFTRGWRERGIEVHAEPERASAGLRRDPLGYAASYVRYHRKVRALLAETGARLVHANDPLAFQLSLSAAKSAGAKIALNLRDTLAPDRRPPRLKYRAMFAAADHVLYLSEDMAERWRQVASNATRSCSVTYSIVDQARFAPSPIDAAGTPVVLVSGLFWPKKGQLDFIRQAVPALARNGVATWLAGDFDPESNPYAKACAAEAEPHGDAVRFVGYRSDMPTLLRQARVVAVPSAHEGLVRTMAEAMSCGRPVVSFDVCSAREMLDEGAGRVVAMGDFAGMTEAILGFCRDPGAASEAGERGHAAASRLFAPGAVLARYERAYEALAAGT